MNKDKSKILKDYINFRSLKNHSSGGLADIENHIKKYLSSSKKPLSEFDEPMLIKYVGKINSEYKTNTSNTIKSSFLKNFIKWYFEDWSSRFRNIDVICATEKPAPTYNPDDMLTEADVQKLIKEEESNFWKAYFLTLFYGGCRPIEVVNLKWKDLEFEDDGAFFSIYSKKNKESFLKFVPSDVSFYLKKLKNNNSDYIFVNPRTKKPISVKGAYWKIRQMSEKYLGKKINLYILRHSIATINYNKDDLKDDIVARQMGHTKSMKSTYVHNDKAKLKENAKKIYFKPEDLPPEKKLELEKKIEEQNKIIKKLWQDKKETGKMLEDFGNQLIEIKKSIKPKK